MFAQLGDIQFEGIVTPSSWSETHGATFAEIPRVGGKAAMQHTAEELVVIELAIRLSREFCDPADILDRLKTAQTRGAVLPLIAGSGVLVGRFVITGLENQVRQTTADGDLISVNLDLSLKEYVFPPGMQEPPQGEAYRANPRPPAQQNTTEAQALSRDVSKGNSAVSGIKTVLTAVQRGVRSLKQGIRMVQTLSNTANMAYTDALIRARRMQKIAERANEMPKSLEEAIAYADNLSKVADVADISSLQFAAGPLIASSEDVKKSSAPAATMAGTREAN